MGTALTGTGKAQARKEGQAHPRSKVNPFPSTLARELVWLGDIRRGHSIKEIARREGLGCRRIQHGVSRACELGKPTQIRESYSSDDLHRRDKTATASRQKTIRNDVNRPPRLVPLFPIGSFTPQSTCPHHGPIQSGSVFCCMICSQSGIDDHPALKRDQHTDPGPERKTTTHVKVAGVRETRKQRRQRLKEARQRV